MPLYCTEMWRFPLQENITLMLRLYIAIITRNNNNSPSVGPSNVILSSNIE